MTNVASLPFNSNCTIYLIIHSSDRPGHAPLIHWLRPPSPRAVDTTPSFGLLLLHIATSRSGLLILHASACRQYTLGLVPHAPSIAVWPPRYMRLMRPVPLTVPFTDLLFFGINNENRFLLMNAPRLHGDPLFEYSSNLSCSTPYCWHQKPAVVSMISRFICHFIGSGNPICLFDIDTKIWDKIHASRNRIDVDITRRLCWDATSNQTLLLPLDVQMTCQNWFAAGSMRS